MNYSSWLGILICSLLMLNETTKIKSIILEYDLIEIHYNKNLKNKPYLVKVFNYNNSEPNELRLDYSEIKDLYNILRQYKYL